MVAESLRTYVVPPGGVGHRLDQHLSLAFTDLSRARIKDLIEQGRVRLAGQPVKPARRLKGGERIEIALPAAVPAVPRAQDLPLRILYQDQDLAVIDKAPGVVVHPGAGNKEGTLVNALLFWLKDLAGIGGELRPGLVHRLDKGTSGCMVVAKNDRALAALQAQFKSRSITKVYLALVQGHPPKRARLETGYGRHPVDRKRFTGRVKGGKSAVTEYEVLERFADAAMLEVRLHTGRTHQIRVHLSEAGYPLLGDTTYSAGRRGTPGVYAITLELGRPALHAWKLQFRHPRTERAMAFEAPVPADLERAIQSLRE